MQTLKWINGYKYIDWDKMACRISIDGGQTWIDSFSKLKTEFDKQNGYAPTGRKE